MRLVLSLADQNFSTTKSMGIFNTSLGLATALAASPAVTKLSVLSNPTLEGALQLPERVAVSQHRSPLWGKAGRIFWDQVGLYHAARRTGAEWLLLPKGFASFASRCPLKLAVHVHDMMFAHYEERYPLAPIGAEAAYFRRGFMSALKTADLIFTSTSFIKDEVEAWAAHKKLTSPPIEVTGLGLVPQPEAENKKDQILVLLSPLPHKLSPMAMEFVERWRRESGYPGRVLGVGTPMNRSRMEQEVDGSSWEMVDCVAPPDWPRTMGESRVVVYTSEYEGFGLPPLEALLAGTPPVYSRIQPICEVMNDAGHSFANGDYSSFAAAMTAALSTPREKIATWRSEVLARYGWEVVCGRIVRALDREMR